MVETEPRVLRTWRGVGGSVAVGLVLLALALIGVQVYAGLHDLPGPGVGVVLGHLLAAAVAVVAQVVADRRTGWVAGLCGLAVLVAGATTLWVFWWA
ncbi:putative secreted protein [Saccharothrix espanaensis DSM 44229]|uniref:Putative secreted protein n=2 Tax=Saccharothrix espanaensis TaxID=103731 RepID=K0JP48_SACES|nr:putative secreted protein [Saccharothrix espanaensis DSM 44229]